MRVVDIKSQALQAPESRRDEVETIFSERFMLWLRCLEQNGLILEGQANVRKRNGTFFCRVVAQGDDALSEQRFNYETRKAAAYLLEMSDGAPEFIDMGRSLMPRGCACGGKSPYLILYPCAEWEGSPIRCGGCNGSFPLYLTKKYAMDCEFGDILNWRKTFRGYVAHFTSGADRRDKYESYQMLNNCVSALSLLGRRLAGDAERGTGILTYYPLFQQDEIIPNACPQCGANWRNPYPAAIRFSHACPACRICMGALG